MSAVLGPGVDEPVCPRCCSRRCASIPARMAYRAAFKAWPRDATDADYDAIAALVDAIPEDCEPASPWKLVERVEALTEENARLRAALSAPPPDAEIERLVDAYGAARHSLGVSPRSMDAEDRAACRAARSTLLTAISRRVPGDLAGLRTVVEVALRVWSRHAEDAEEWGVIADLRAALGATCVCWPGFVAGGIVHADSCPARPRACDLANLAPPAPAEES